MCAVENKSFFNIFSFSAAKPAFAQRVAAAGIQIFKSVCSPPPPLKPQMDIRDSSDFSEAYVTAEVDPPQEAPAGIFFQSIFSFLTPKRRRRFRNPRDPGRERLEL